MSSNWESIALKDVCEFFSDGDWVESKDQSAGGIRLIQTGNVGIGEFKARGEKARYVSEETFGRLRCTEIFEGDCLISRLPDPVGRACVVPSTGERMITAVDCSIVRFRKGVLIPEFFNYYAQSHSYLRAVDAETTGATRKRISRSVLGQIPVPVPSIAEQQRLVAILDQAFAGIATAVANSEKNLANAREVFTSALVIEIERVQKHARMVTLSKITDEISDGDHQPPPKSVSGIPFITITNIDKATREIDFKDTFKVPKEYFDALKANRRPRRGDVLYTVTGSYGIPVQISSDQEFCFQRHIGLLRPSQSTDSRWLYYLMMSPQVIAQANECATGAAQKTVSLKSLRNFSVPEICLDQQREIVKRLNQITEQTAKLGTVYQQKLATLNELKQSILHQAFTGQLH